MKNNQIHIGSRKIIAAEEIKMLQADINYTVVYLINGKQLLVSTTMGAIEKRLPMDYFVRVSRSVIINSSCVLKYRLGNQFDEIEVPDALFLKVSRRRRVLTRKILDKL